MEQKRVRICDIAEELGLSTATVSNVIHGKTHKVSDETVKRVQALLEQRQYIPSMAGILLAQNDSGIIGVVVNDHEKYESHTLEDVFIASSLNWLSLEIERSGKFMMVKRTTDQQEIIRFASMWNLEGLVLIGFCWDWDYSYLRSHMRVPFVVYDGFCEVPDRICNITIDNFDGGYQVGRHFRELGHQRVLCISDNLICVDEQRYRGFCAGFGAGVSHLMIPMQKEERMAFYAEHLEQLRSVTAVFAVSDHYAVELMQFLTEQGLSVPDDIAIAGFDDAPVCTMVSPRLTSVRQDVAVRAEIAVRKLRELKVSSDAAEEILLPVTLMVRGTTVK